VLPQQVRETVTLEELVAWAGAVRTLERERLRMWAVVIHNAVAAGMGTSRPEAFSDFLRELETADVVDDRTLDRMKGAGLPVEDTV
jgi:hypothetical protein